MTEKPVAFCMLATTFDARGGIDEHALRANVDRMVAAGNGIYLGSGGAGEGHALSMDEFDLVYRAGVEQCAGRVPVYANPPEPRTADGFIRTALRAVKAGVDVVQCYQLDAGHGMRPTLAEQTAYYTEILREIRHPIALSLHTGSGYLPPVELLSDLAGEFPQLTAINIIGLPTSYFVSVRDALPAGVKLYTRLADAMTGLALGASGTLSAENNLIPHLCAAVLGRWARGDIDGAAIALAEVMRVSNIVNRWAPSTARWVKMGMRVMKLPGHAGGLRRPYLMPAQADVDRMAQLFGELQIQEKEERTRLGEAVLTD